MKNGVKIDVYQKDGDVLKLMQKCDDRAFNLLYKRYWGPLLNFAAHNIHDADRCEEIVQQLFVRLHARRSALQIRSSVSSYLYAALRHRIFNYLRDKAVYQKHVLHAARARSTTHSNNNVEQFIDLGQLQQEIGNAISRMPEKYKEVYLLRDENYFTINKISKVLNRPVDTVEKKMRRATELLKNNLRAVN